MQPGLPDPLIGRRVKPTWLLRVLVADPIGLVHHGDVDGEPLVEEVSATDSSRLTMQAPAWDHSGAPAAARWA